MHAKLTRDRKKLFTSRMQQMINSLESQNVVMKSKLKSLVGGGESPNAVEDREQRTDASQEQFSNSTDYPRQNIGLHHFNNKIMSGFSASLLEVLNKNIVDFSDSSTGDPRRSNTHGISIPFPDNDSKRQKASHFTHSHDSMSNVPGNTNPFLGTLGPLNRTYQSDMFPSINDYHPPPSFFEAL